MNTLFALFFLAACGTETPVEPAQDGPAEAQVHVETTAKTAAASPDIAHGKATVTGKCTKCHDSEVYTRADHKVKDAIALKGQVEACSGAAPLDETEKQDVTAYLSKEMYHFE